MDVISLLNANGSHAGNKHIGKVVLNVDDEDVQAFQGIGLYSLT